MALLIVLDVLLGSQAHYRKTALLALFYASNWAIISGLDFGPIEHTWTLAIEEHFYLLWPLTMVLVLRRWSRSALLRIAVAAALCSWTGRVVLWASGASLERVTYGTDTRLDGLLIGCILGLTAWERIRRVPLGATVAALAVLVTAVTVPTTGFHVVAGYTAVSVATLVIIAGCLTSERVAGVLDRRPLVPIGRISYGLYLWHLPIYGTVFLYGGGLLSKPVQMVTAVVMSFIVAACSYASIERPFLRLKRRGRQRGVGATPGCVGAAVLAPPVDSGAAEPGGQPAGPLLPAQRGPS